MPSAYKLKKEMMYVIMNKERRIKNIIYILMFSLLIFIILVNNELIKTIFNIKYLMIISILISIVIINVFQILFNIKKNIQILLMSYILLIIICLFIREPFEDYKKENIDYIYKWLKLIFTNQIVFINIIGNICLFVPFGIIINKYNINYIVKLIISLLMITIIEILQYITKRGIFDYIDILLNYIGVIIGIIITTKKKRGKEYE
jgi:hypothetical protein